MIQVLKKNWRKLLAGITIVVFGAGWLTAGISWNRTADTLEDTENLLEQATTAIVEYNDITIPGMQKQIDDNLVKIEELTLTTEGTSAEVEKLTKENKNLQDQIARDKIIIEDMEEVIAEYETTEVGDFSFGGEVLDDLPFNEAVGVIILDDGDIEYFLDERISFEGDRYDVEERFFISDDVSVLTSLYGDEEFADSPYVVFNDEGAIAYEYVFKDPIEYDLISEDDELEIDFLGVPIKIVDVDENSVTIFKGQQFTGAAGDTIEYLDHDITVDTVYDDGILITVNGESEVIEEDDTDTVGGLSVTVLKAFENDQNTLFKILIGDDTEIEYDDGDDFGENDDFIFTVSVDSEYLYKIGVSYDVKADDIDEEVLGVGDYVGFGDYFNFKFESITDTDYIDYDLSFDEATDDDFSTIKIESSDDEGLIINNEELDVVWVDKNNVYYEDEDNDWITEDLEDLIILNDGIEYEVSYTQQNPQKGWLHIGPINFHVANSFTSFGEPEEDNSRDIIVEGVELGTRDNDVLLTDGTIIYSPEDSLENDEVSFSVPDDEVEAVITVGK